MKKTLLQAYKVVICSSPVWVNYASRMSKSAAIEVMVLSLCTVVFLLTYCCLNCWVLALYSHSLAYFGDICLDSYTQDIHVYQNKVPKGWWLS